MFQLAALSRATLVVIRVCLAPELKASASLASCRHLVQCIRHVVTAFQAAEAAVQQLEQKLLNEGTNWRLQFLQAKRAPQESFSEQFKQLARYSAAVSIIVCNTVASLCGDAVIWHLACQS